MVEQPTPVPRSPVRYQIPTHLSVPDRIAIPLLGITFHVTMRQGLISVVGWCTAFNLWRHLAGLSLFGWPGLLLRICIPLVLALATIVVATLQMDGRYVEEWAVLLLRYRRHPRVLLWRPLVRWPQTPVQAHVHTMTGKRKGIPWLS